MEKISIVVVDDHPVIRHGVTSVIKKQADMHMVGESDAAATALPLIKKTDPDVVILDVTMAGISGIDLIPYIKSLSENTRIIIYSMHQSPDVIYRSLKAGAKAYVLKADEIRDLLEAIRTVMQGQMFLSRSLPQDMEEQLLRGEAKKGPLSNLTAREYEIANLLSQGMPPDEIGETLFISPKTVRVHRTNIMHKLNCDRSHELLLLLRDYFPR